MCDPVSALMAIGTAVGAYGQVQAGRAAQANANFQAQIAVNNAQIVDNQIADAKVRGADAEQQVLREGAQVLGNTRAALASNNLDLTFGSPLDTIFETSMEIQRDAYRTRRNTGAEVDDLETQKLNFLNSATASRMEGKNAKRAGYISGVSTALSGASEVGKYKASIK